MAEGAGDTRLAEIRASARGWHGAQLAVLGFVGLCGVLQRTGGELPRWLQILAGSLVLLALVLSCLATALVASVAWPTYGGQSGGVGSAGDLGEASELRRAGRRLRVGIAVTFLAVAVLALGATSTWWPQKQAAPALVRISTDAGELCGELQDAEPGQVALAVSGQRLVLAVSQVVRLRPAESCD